MGRTHKISEKMAEEVKEIRKGIKDKNTDRRLFAVQLRGEGYKNSEIAQRLETIPAVVSQWVSAYVKGGVQALYPKKRTGNHRNISEAEEKEILEKFKKDAEAGKIIEISEIKKAYVEKVGHNIGNGQIYRVLKRNGWRKVMPRSRHPKKASDEAIEASKKLNPK